ncbi:MAG: transporter substrate-binding domain-containing protein [Rhodospirillales bacterium]
MNFTPLKSRRLWTLAALILALAWLPPLATATAADPDKISIAYCEDCVPFHFRDSKGQPSGMIIDVWRLWAERTGTKIEFRAAPWDETLRMVAGGRADVHAGLFFNEERNKFLDYGAELAETDTNLFVDKDLGVVESLSALTGNKVGVLAGDYVEGYLKERLPPKDVIGFESYEALIGAIRQGRIKIFAADTPTGIYHLQKSGLGYGFRFNLDNPLYRNKWHVAVTKGNKKLLRFVDAGMGRISDAERSAIQRRWTSIGVLTAPSAEVSPDVPDILTKEERQWLADHPVIKVHNEKDFPPLNFFAAGRAQGFSIDYMRLLASKIGVRLEFVTGPTWSKFLGMMQSGELDIMLNIVRTPEREKFLLYTRPYASNPNSILSRKGEIYQNLESLQGKTVAVPRGFFHEEILGKDFPRIKLHLVTNILEGMKAVAFGDADAAVGELAVFNYLLGRELMTDLVVSGELKLGSESFNQLRIAARKDLPVLAAILEKGMDAITPDELKLLRDRWITGASTVIAGAEILNEEERGWLKEHPVIRFTPDPSFPPFEFFDEQGQFRGIAADYIDLIQKKLNIRFEIIRP